MPGLDDELLTSAEVMAYLRISRATLYRIMEKGELSAYKVSETLRFHKKDVVDFVEKGRVVKRRITSLPHILESS